MNLQSAEDFLKTYAGLSSADYQVREYSNKVLMEFVETPQAWIVARQLLVSGSHEERFLGGQLLNRKTVNAINTLSLSQLKELKFECLQMILNEASAGQPSNQVIYILARTIALSWLWICRDQANLQVEELVEFMKQSQQSLMCGILILRSIPEEFKNIVSKTVSNQIMGYLTSKNVLIRQILNELLVSSRRETLTIILECIENWTQLGVNLLSDHQIIEFLLNLCKISKNYFENCSQIFIEAFKHPTNSNQELKSLSIIVSFLIENTTTLLSSDQTSESFAQLLEEILLSSLCQIILKDPSNTIDRLLEIMFSIVKHKSLDTSHYSIRFWISFYRQHKSNNRAVKLSLQYYSQVFQALQEKCLLNSPWNYPEVYESSQNIELDLMQVVQTGPKGMMMFRQYRQFGTQLFQVIYKFFTQTQGNQQGNKRYFDSIFELFKTSSQITNRNERVELALFMTKSIMDVSTSQSKAYISAILTCIPTSINDDVAVKLEALKLMASCCRQIGQNHILFELLTAYALSNISQPYLSTYSTFVFVSFVECLKEHNMVALSEELLAVYTSPAFQLIAQDPTVKFIQGYLQFIFLFDSKKQQTTHLQNFLNCIGKQLNQSIQHLKQQHLLKCFIKLSTIVRTLDQLDRHNAEALAKIIQPFLQKTLVYVEMVLKLGFQISSEKNVLGLAGRIVRDLLKIPNSQPEESRIISIMDCITKIFISHPKQNCNLLGTVAFIIQYFGQKQSVMVGQWLTINLESLLNFTLKNIDINSIHLADSDYIRNLYCICQKTCRCYPQQLPNPNHPLSSTLLSLCLSSLSSITQTQLCKQLLMFLQSYLNSNEPSLLLPILPSIILTIFDSLPNINRILFQMVVAILKHANGIVGFEVVLRQCRWMREINGEQVRGMADSISRAIMVGDAKAVKTVLSFVVMVAKGITSEDLQQKLARICGS